MWWDQGPVSDPSLFKGHAKASNKGLNFPAFRRQWWRLYMSEIFLNEMKTIQSINQSINRICKTHVVSLSAEDEVLNDSMNKWYFGEGRQKNGWGHIFGNWSNHLTVDSNQARTIPANRKKVYGVDGNGYFSSKARSLLYNELRFLHESKMCDKPWRRE